MKTKNVLRLYLVMSVLEEPIFWGPIIILAMSKLAGMTVAEIFFSEALAVALVFVLDAPSGVVADMIGRKKCVVIGRFCLLLSMIFFAFMEKAWHAYVANFFWAVGISLRSGAESAMIYDELRRRNALNEYPALMKRCHGFFFLLAIPSAVLTGFIAEKFGLRTPLLLSIPGVCLSMLLVYFFPKEEVFEKVHTIKSYCEHLVEAIKETAKNKKLWIFMFWFALLSVIGKVYFFMYNPYLELVKVPYSQIGFIFAGLNLISLAATWYTFWLHEKIGRFGFGVWFSSQGVIMLAQAYFLSAWCGWLFSAQGVLRGYGSTIREPILNNLIPDEKRATMLSFDSSFSSLLQVLSFAIIAPISNNLVISLYLLGGISFFFAFFSRRW